MSEKTETDQGNAQEPSKDLVGDILRKERITRRITVETIAKDLKLNVKYIKSLEASEYESLPADPYVRVYLRSLAKYLSLDPESILKQFYSERGLSAETKRETTKITINMKEKETRSPMLMIAIILILLLAIFSFVANRKGWISSSNQSTTQKDTSSVKTATSDSVSVDSLTDTLSSYQPNVVNDSTAVEATADSVKNNGEPLHLHIEVLRDSAWVQVFSDGLSWKNVISQRQGKEFTSRDSFNVHVGNNSIVKYRLNGQPLKVKGNGVVAFKLDKSGIPVVWSNSRWNSIFKDRN
jgi:cytoskeletal protein RodZ